MKFKAGELATTHKGNLCMVIKLGGGKTRQTRFYDIVFPTSGFVRSGYPEEWLQKLKPDTK